MTAVAKKDEVPIDVTWEDQRSICTFSRLHRRVQLLLKRQKTLDDDIEKIDDAATEVMISDDVMYVFGEAFVGIDSDKSLELLEAERNRLAEQKSDVDTELKELEEVLGQLKAQLYAKFGSQIYLDDK